MSTKSVSSAKSSAELLSYIINVTPELRDNIDLPVQGESIAPIGKIIMNNARYRNAFINTVNLIATTVIKRNTWENTWDNFTERGTIRNGQQVREIINDLCNVYDYNQEMLNDKNETRFLKTVVPNVLNYMHELNFQKFYQTTTSDEQLAMAFEQGDLFSFIDDVVNMLFESFAYDRYVVNKYMLCRRILDGTIPAVQIANFATKTNREIVAEIKSVSNKMTFRSPNYNPAGIRRAASFENQIAIVNTDFDAKFTTDVLATSYFKDEADMKARLALIDSFSGHDEERLAELFAVRDESGNIVSGEYLNGYVPFTSDEKTALAEIPCVIISREWFMNYRWQFDNSSSEKVTEFYNPTTLKNNHFLHAWVVFSTSPFESCAVFTQTAQNVTAVTVSPSEATVYKGQELKLSASVTNAGFANKAVLWSVNDAAIEQGARITQEGVLKVPTSYKGVAGRAGVYTITIGTALGETDELIVGGVEYTPAAGDDTAAEQAAALETALEADETLNATYTITSSSDTVTLTEKSGHYAAGAPEVDESGMSTGDVTLATTTEPIAKTNTITVTATSIYKDSVSGTATITVS